MDDGLGVVVERVRGGEHAAALRLQRFKGRVPRLPRRQLQRVAARAGERRNVRPPDGQRHAQPFAERPAEALVAGSLVPADAVMDMDGGDGERIPLPQLQQDAQQRDRIRAAGQANRHAAGRQHRKAVGRCGDTQEKRVIRHDRIFPPAYRSGSFCPAR